MSRAPPAATAAAAASEQPADQPASSKRQRESHDDRDDDLRRFFRSWAWKREHRPDKERFHRPYIHTMTSPAARLSITQRKFSRAEGFASTVWDSSIVVAKYLEKLEQQQLAGQRCLDLSAGCGLVAVVMAKLGARVTATDLEGNLQLLRDNCRSNGVADVTVAEHRWSSPAPHLLPPFDVICACDVMYVDELVTPLVASLLLLSHASSLVLLAHGRNRPAEPAFRAAAAQHFSIDLVPPSELDETYQCSDVDVLRLRRKAPAAAVAHAGAGPSAAAAAAAKHPDTAGLAALTGGRTAGCCG